MIRRQSQVLYEEGRETGKVMCIALDPWIIGQPHRIGPLVDALDFIAAHSVSGPPPEVEIVEAYLQQQRET